MMGRYPNLYGDTAVLASLNRWRALARLSRESAALRDRIVHGSDYPFPPATLPYVFRLGLFPRTRGNPLDLDLRIKQSFALGPAYGSQVLKLMGLGEKATDERT
jgi:hypothetical protein